MCVGEEERKSLTGEIWRRAFFIRASQGKPGRQQSQHLLVPAAKTIHSLVLAAGTEAGGKGAMTGPTHLARGSGHGWIRVGGSAQVPYGPGHPSGPLADGKIQLLRRASASSESSLVKPVFVPVQLIHRHLRLTGTLR